MRAKNTSMKNQKAQISDMTTWLTPVKRTDYVHQSQIVGLMLLFLVVSTAPCPLFAEDISLEIDVKAIVKKIDQLYRGETSYAEMEMQIVTPHWKRTLALEVWTKGMDQTFILIKSPKKEKGITTLRIGNEMWNYLPKTNKVIKIPPSMMMSSWMGSDFTNDDLVKESSMLDDYSYQLITAEEAQVETLRAERSEIPSMGTTSLLYIQLTPKEGSPIVWGKIVAAIRASDYIPVWQNFYDEKGRLMRMLDFKEIKQFNGRKIPSIMEMIPQNKKDHKTVVQILAAEFDSPIDDKIFTLRNLRKRR